MKRSAGIAVCLVVFAGTVSAEPGSRAPACTGGMGVSYLSIPDVADLAMGASTTHQRVDEFVAAVMFTAAFGYPLDSTLWLKADYTYILGTYTVNGFFGQTAFAVHGHMPVLEIQYVLLSGQTYNVMLGGGGGYLLGQVTRQSGAVEDAFTAHGVCALLGLEANTGLGDQLYGHFGGELRWSFTGELRGAGGQSPGVNAAGNAADLHFFGVGIRFGLTYYF